MPSWKNLPIFHDLYYFTAHAHFVIHFKYGFFFQTENTLSTYEPHACVIVYSATDRQSFKTAEEILGYLWRFGYTKSKSMILVANKVDLERSRMISIEGDLL